MTIEFAPAVREQMLLREALIGPTGSGKTYAALRQAVEIASSIEKVFVVDSENERARLEVPTFGEFPHYPLPRAERNPAGYTAAMARAWTLGAEVVILDSVSPEWKAVLGEVDKRFGQWKDVRPKHDEWIESMIYAPGHLIVTMRAKMKYLVSEVQTGERTRQQIEPQGMGPIQDDNLPYEFDVVAYLDRTHMATFSNRCRPLDGKSMTMDDAAPIVREWLAEGEKAKPPAAADPERVQVLRDLLARKRPELSAERIEGILGERRAQNRGELHPDYVEEQIESLEKLPDKTDEPEPAETTT